MSDVLRRGLLRTAVAITGAVGILVPLAPAAPAAPAQPQPSMAAGGTVPDPLLAINPAGLFAEGGPDWDAVLSEDVGPGVGRVVMDLAARTYPRDLSGVGGLVGYGDDDPGDGEEEIDLLSITLLPELTRILIELLSGDEGGLGGLGGLGELLGGDGEEGGLGGLGGLGEVLTELLNALLGGLGGGDDEGGPLGGLGGLGELLGGLGGGDDEGGPLGGLGGLGEVLTELLNALLGGLGGGDDEGGPLGGLGGLGDLGQLGDLGELLGGSGDNEDNLLGLLGLIRDLLEGVLELLTGGGEDGGPGTLLGGLLGLPGGDDQPALP